MILVVMIFGADYLVDWEGIEVPISSLRIGTRLKILSEVGIGYKVVLEHSKHLGLRLSTVQLGKGQYPVHIGVDLRVTSRNLQVKRVLVPGRELRVASVNEQPWLRETSNAKGAKGLW